MTTQRGVGSNYGVFLSQEFEIAGQRTIRTHLASQDVAKAAAELAGARLDLAAQVKTAFVDALVSFDRIDTGREGLEATTKLCTHLAARKLLSDAQRMELNNAQIQESRARRDVASTEQMRDTALTTLRRLVGLPPVQDLELIGVPTTTVRSLPSETEVIERTSLHRADVTAQRHALDGADAQVALTRREAIPNVTISGNLSQFEGATLAGGDIGFQLPVFQRKTADLNEAVAEREAARLQLQSLERIAQQEALDARRTCEVAAVDLRAFQETVVPKSQENLQLQRRLYDRGQATYAELMGTELELLAARREYLDAVQAYNEALIELERVIGGPW